MPEAFTRGEQRVRALCSGESPAAKDVLIRVKGLDLKTRIAEVCPLPDRGRGRTDLGRAGLDELFNAVVS